MLWNTVLSTGSSGRWEWICHLKVAIAFSSVSFGYLIRFSKLFSIPIPSLLFLATKHLGRGKVYLTSWNGVRRESGLNGCSLLTPVDLSFSSPVSGNWILSSIHVLWMQYVVFCLGVGRVWWSWFRNSSISSCWRGIISVLTGAWHPLRPNYDSFRAWPLWIMTSAPLLCGHFNLSKLSALTRLQSQPLSLCSSVSSPWSILAYLSYFYLTWKPIEAWGHHFPFSSTVLSFCCYQWQVGLRLPLVLDSFSIWDFYLLHPLPLPESARHHLHLGLSLSNWLLPLIRSALYFSHDKWEPSSCHILYSLQLWLDIKFC